MRKRNPYDGLVTVLFSISKIHFHSALRREVAIRMQGDPSCPSGIAMLNRAMYGKKCERQCFDLYCKRTMEKSDYNIGVYNPCLYNHPDKYICIQRHSDDLWTLATRTLMAEFQEHLSNHLLVNHNATLDPATIDACEVRLLNRVILLVVPPFGKGARTY